MTCEDEHHCLQFGCVELGCQAAVFSNLWLIETFGCLLAHKFEERSSTSSLEEIVSLRLWKQWMFVDLFRRKNRSNLNAGGKLFTYWSFSLSFVPSLQKISDLLLPPRSFLDDVSFFHSHRFVLRCVTRLFIYLFIGFLCECQCEKENKETLLYFVDCYFFCQESLLQKVSIKVWIKFLPKKLKNKTKHNIPKQKLINNYPLSE